MCFVMLALCASRKMNGNMISISYICMFTHGGMIDKKIQLFLLSEISIYLS